MSSSGPPTLVSSKAYGEEISQHPEFEAPDFLRYEQSPRTMMVSLVWKGAVGGRGRVLGLSKGEDGENR